MNSRLWISAISLSLLSQYGLADEASRADGEGLSSLNVAVDDERWQIDAADHEVVDYLGQRALRLKGGIALLPDIDVHNGLVEFDMAMTGERGFAGAAFRAQDADNFEHFYLRPHMSGNPDANQYEPVINGVAAWQLYQGDGFSAPVKYALNSWVHVKIIFAGDQADVYIDSTQPVLHINALKRSAEGGGLGLDVANFAPVHFANFRYAALADDFTFPPAPAAPAAPNMIRSWQVSDAFPAALLHGLLRLDEAGDRRRSWQSMDAEPSGLVNLAVRQGIQDDRDTVFARVNIPAAERKTVRFKFGYSDVAAVYLNGALKYQGNNTYQTRDYRYLGTIGLFDSLILPLDKGDNDLRVAVTEHFGGWGVMGRITAIPDTP